MVDINKRDANTTRWVNFKSEAQAKGLRINYFLASFFLFSVSKRDRQRQAPSTVSSCHDPTQLQAVPDHGHARALCVLREVSDMDQERSRVGQPHRVSWSHQAQDKSVTFVSSIWYAGDYTGQLSRGFWGFFLKNYFI